MKKALKIVGIVLAALVLLVVLCVVVFMLIQPLLYGNYYKQAQKEIAIPGLNDGVVPQGFDYVADEDLFVEVGYMTDGESASRIYLTDADGNSRYIELLAADGSPYLGHTGGIAVGKSLVWLANDGDEAAQDNCVWVLSREQLLDASTKQITLTERFFPECRSACVGVYDGLLWVGEFYDPEKYPTKESHHLQGPTGETNPSFICGYEIDESKPTGLAAATPKKILSVGQKLQGFAFNAEGKVALSTSYGLNNSHIYLHENVLTGAPDASFAMGETEVPVWFLDGDSLIEDVEAPPMSEELVAKDGRLHILYESACHKYLFGNFMRGRRVYSYPF